MRKITALLMASSLALGTMGVVHAADNNMQEGMKNDMPLQHHKASREAKHEHIFKNLNLSEAQRQQIRTLMQEKHRQTKTSWQADKRDMHALVASDHFDHAKALAQVDKIAAQDKARMLSHLETQNKIYNILTPEQKKQFNDNFEKRLTEQPAH